MENEVNLVKPVVLTITGIRFVGDNYVEVMNWLGKDSAVMYLDCSPYMRARVYLPENQSWEDIKAGDWIIRQGGNETRILPDEDVQALYDDGWADAPVS